MLRAKIVIGGYIEKRNSLLVWTVSHRRRWTEFRFRPKTYTYPYRYGAEGDGLPIQKRPPI